LPTDDREYCVAPTFERTAERRPDLKRRTGIPSVRTALVITVLLDLALPGGRIAIFGRTAGNIPAISPRTLFWKQISIFGTSGGTEDEFLSMLDFIYKHKIKPSVDKTFPLSQINEAFARMQEGDQFGKIVLTIP